VTDYYTDSGVADVACQQVCVLLRVQSISLARVRAREVDMSRLRPLNDGHFFVTQLQSIARAIGYHARINYRELAIRIIRYHAALSLIIRDQDK